jgi:hypothetical protein
MHATRYNVMTSLLGIYVSSLMLPAALQIFFPACIRALQELKRSAAVLP